MKIIERIIFKDFQKQIKPGKVLILLGARRVGKTHLLKRVISNLDDGN
jgi:predicted AAA+ superfamily ATPase